MQRHEKRKARILSFLLSAAMVTTMMSGTVFAAEDGNVTPEVSPLGTIQSFDKLEERFTPSVGENAPKHVYALSVNLNTPFEDLDLPEELTAMVARTTVTAPAEDEPVIDSDKPDEPTEPDKPTEPDEPDEDETTPEVDNPLDGEPAADGAASDKQPASPSDTQEEAVVKEIQEEQTPLAPEPEQNTPPEAEDKKTADTTVEQEAIPVTWQGNKEYRSNENGEFIYTAALPEGYTLADGVKLPQIYVYVGRQARAAGDATILVDGNNGYTLDQTGLQKAFTDVASGGIVKIGGEITFNTAITIAPDKSVTLDLNGQTVTYSGGPQLVGGIIVSDAASLTVTDSTSGKNGKYIATGENSVAIQNTGAGTVTISGGTVSADGTSSTAIPNEGAGAVIVSGGTVSATGMVSAAIDNRGTGTITVSSGTVSATGEDAYAIYNGSIGGTITVSGGAVSAASNPAIGSNSLKKITISDTATVTSACTTAGTIALYKVPTDAPLLVLDIQGGTVNNTGTPEGYSVYFEPKSVTADNISNYYRQAAGTTVGRIYPIKPVTDITGVPTAAVAGTDLTLTGTVVPANATNKTIVWSVKDQGTTGATIEGGKLKTTMGGTATVTATITNGLAEGNYIKDFEIRVTAASAPVSGTVTDSSSAAVSGATIKLMQGSTVKYTTTTDADGKYSIANVLNGAYNIVVTDSDSVTITDSIAVAGIPVTKNMQFLGNKKNTVVESTPGTPNVAVGGMNDLLNASNIGSTLTTEEKNAVSSGGSVELKFVADVKTASEVSDDKGKIEAIATGKAIDLLLDLSVLKTVKASDGTTTTNGQKIPALAELIAVAIPIPQALQSKSDLAVYRVHNGTAEAMGNGSLNASTDGEYFEFSGDRTYLTLHVKNFSTYALASKPQSVTAPGSSVTSSSGTSSGGSSSSGSKERSPVLRKTEASGTINSIQSKNNTTGIVSKAIKKAIAAGDTTAFARVIYKNYTYLALDGLKTINEIAAKESAEKDVTLDFKVNFDAGPKNRVDSRITVDPAALAKVMSTKLPLGVYFNQKDTQVQTVNNLFAKRFHNKVVSIVFAQKTPLAVNVEFAAKLDLSGLNTDKLYFYSYDPIKNTHVLIKEPNFWVDTKGYSHITVPFGGSIIITDQPLTER